MIPAWVAEWTARADGELIAAEGAAYLRSRPIGMRHLILRFPPGSVVRWRCGLHGEHYAVVMSYFEHDPPTLTIQDEPLTSAAYHVPPEDLGRLEVVGYFRGQLTPQKVLEVLDVFDAGWDA